MKLTHLSNQVIVISRLIPVSGSADKLALSTVTACLGHLQPVAREQTQLIGGVPGKMYRLFVDSDKDLKENDQLKDEEGNIYTVVKGGVTRWQHGAMDFKEAVIQRS